MNKEKEVLYIVEKKGNKKGDLFILIDDEYKPVNNYCSLSAIPNMEGLEIMLKTQYHVLFFSKEEIIKIYKENLDKEDFEKIMGEINKFY